MKITKAYVKMQLEKKGWIDIRKKCNTCWYEDELIKDVIDIINEKLKELGKTEIK
jgi:hypothetical protein